jgi:hypothetical protein
VPFAFIAPYLNIMRACFSLTSLCLPLASLRVSALPVQPVQIVDRSDFHPNKHYYHIHPDGTQFETPVLVESVLSKQECESILGQIVNELGDEFVTIQRKKRSIDENGSLQVEADIAEETLMNAFAYIMESHHDDAFFCFCEGLLDGRENLNEVKRMLRSAKERLFEVNFDDEKENDESNRDMFEFFPTETQTTDCVVIAGEGATSTLHRDPYTWTGTSLCLEGTKIWRFIAPPGVLMAQKSINVSLIDDAVKSYRLPSVAWDEHLYLSSGWQSDMSLFAIRNEDIPSAEEFATLEDENPKQTLEAMKAIAMSTEKLIPSLDFPLHLAGNDAPILFTVVQKPGDLLVIPAFWWHQTYALEPSVAIASQRGGTKRDAKRVITHVFETVGFDIHANELPSVLKEVLDESYTGPAKDITKSLFEVLSSM